MFPQQHAVVPVCSTSSPALTTLHFGTPPILVGLNRYSILSLICIFLRTSAGQLRMSSMLVPVSSPIIYVEVFIELLLSLGSQ